MSRPPFPTHIDSSMRASFTACPRKFFYNYVQKRVLSAGNIHLTFGGAMARGLEVTRLAFWRDGLPFAQALALGQEAIVRNWIASTTPFEPEGTPKSLKSCVEALERYFQFFDPHDDHIVPFQYHDGDTSQRAVEFTFAVPLPFELGFPSHPVTGLPILYTGRFDMLATSKAGANFIVDDKTTGQLGLNFTRSMKLRSQFTGYKWACDCYGIPTSGVIIRATCVQRTQMVFQEIIESRPDHVVAQWLDQLTRDVSRMVAMWEEDHWQMALDDACGSYGGCTYLDACLAPNPQSVIDAFYTDDNWDPLHETEAATPSL